MAQQENLHSQPLWEVHTHLYNLSWCVHTHVNSHSESTRHINTLITCQVHSILSTSLVGAHHTPLPPPSPLHTQNLPGHTHSQPASNTHTRSQLLVRGAQTQTRSPSGSPPSAHTPARGPTPTPTHPPPRSQPSRGRNPPPGPCGRTSPNSGGSAGSAPAPSPLPPARAPAHLSRWRPARGPRPPWGWSPG